MQSKGPQLLCLACTSMGCIRHICTANSRRKDPHVTIPLRRPKLWAQLRVSDCQHCFSGDRLILRTKFTRTEAVSTTRGYYTLDKPWLLCTTEQILETALREHRKPPKIAKGSAIVKQLPCKSGYMCYTPHIPSQLIRPCYASTAVRTHLQDAFYQGGAQGTQGANWHSTLVMI